MKSRRLSSFSDQPRFQDVTKASEYREALRWPKGPICPHRGVIGGCNRSLKNNPESIGCFVSVRIVGIGTDTPQPLFTPKHSWLLK